METIFQLLYFSRSNISSKSDLKALADQSSRLNAEHGLTGVLVYQEAYFLQLLEGPRDVVLRLFEDKIKKDPRHRQVVRLLFQQTNKRLFPDWHMKFHSIKAETRNFAAEILLWQNDLPTSTSVDETEITNLFQMFDEGEKL